MSDRPEERTSAISVRRMVSSIPSALRIFRLEPVSSARRPERTWPRLGGDGEGDEVGGDVAIGVEDVAQEHGRRPAGDAREVRPDAMALALVLVAGLAVLGEERRASGGVAREREGGLIARDHRGSIGRGRAGEDRLGTFPHRGIGKVTQGVAAGRVELGDGDLLSLESLDEHAGRGGRRDHRPQKLATRPQGKLAPRIEDPRGELRTADLADRPGRRGLEARRLVGRSSSGMTHAATAGRPRTSASSAILR